MSIAWKLSDKTIVIKKTDKEEERKRFAQRKANEVLCKIQPETLQRNPMYNGSQTYCYLTA